MCELINVFQKLSEFYHPTLLWEEIDGFYSAEQDKAKQAVRHTASTEALPATSRQRRRNASSSSDSSGMGDEVADLENNLIHSIPIVREALSDSHVLSAVLEVCTTIRALRETAGSYDNTYDCWDQVIQVSPRDGYLSFIFTLVGLGNFDPKCRRFRQLSLAASSAYFLSLTIPGAKGFHIFEDEVIAAALQGFNLIQKIQNPDVASTITKHESIETWVNFTSFCDDLKMIFRFVHFEEYKGARNAIIRKLIDMLYLNHTKGFFNAYAVNLHRKYFEILDEVVSAHNGDPKETLLKIVNMTVFLHTYAPKPKGQSAVVQSSECEHISDWFIRIIGKFPRIVSEVLEFYIKCMVTNPERSWKNEETQRALEYAAKYDAALFTRCNASIVDFLSEAVYAEEVSIRSRAVDLFAKMILIESHVDWELFRHQVSEIPREVYIIKELIDSIRDSNNSIKVKAVQAIQQAIVRGSPNAKKILLEGLKFAHFNDCNVKLPEEPKVLKNEIRFGKPNNPEPAYTFNGVEIVLLSFLYLPRHLYQLFSNPVASLRRAAVMLVETIVKINPLIIFNTDFVKETCNLVYESTQLVRKQTLLMVDAILATYPNCYPVIYVWCKIIAPMMQDNDPKNIELAMECFRTRVLLNIKGIDQTNQAEHFMPWVIIRTLLMTKSRLYLQTNFHTSLKTNLIDQQIITTVESHILASNSTEAWILLNFICGKAKSKEPDSLIHCFVSYHSSMEWNNEQNLLIALEVLTSCAEDFSFSALNYVFKHLLDSIKSGMIIPQVIGKAFDFLTTIDHRSREHQMRSTPSTSRQIVEEPPQDWIIDLHVYLEEKLLEEMPHFPENRSTYLSHLFSYSEANLQVKIRPHRTIVSFIHKYMLACVELPESELETDNDRLFNSMILIAGRFSIREVIIASQTCKLYARILKTIDRPPIVNTVLVAIADICKKHTHVVETIMNTILEKLSSPYLMNRMETFNSFATLVLQDQLKLRGSLLLALLSVVLDESTELAAKATAFFAEFVIQKNPGLYQKCLIECPFVLNEYPNIEGLSNFTENMIRSPLKGDDKRKARLKLYNHLMESIDDVHLLLYFGNLKIIAEKAQNDHHIKSPEGIALVRDMLFILKRVCQRDGIEAESQLQSEISTDETNGVAAATNSVEGNSMPSTSAAAIASAAASTSAATSGSAAATQMKGRPRRRNIPTKSDALSTLEKSIAFIPMIAEHHACRNEAIQKAIDDLAKAISMRFPQVIEFALPTAFWSKYRRGRVISTPIRRRRSSNSRATPIDETFVDNDDEDDEDNETLPTPRKQQRRSEDTLEYILLP